MIPVRFLPRGSADTSSAMRAANDRAFRANSNASLQTRLRPARHAGYRTGLDEERYAIIQGLGMSSEIPLATPDEAELVFSLLRWDLDASSRFYAVREAVGCAVRTTSNPRTSTAEVDLVYNLLRESVVDPEATGTDRN